MHDLDTDPVPQGELALKITALPRDCNSFGDIYGGWLVAQMDAAGTSIAARIARGRVATVAIDRMGFMVPVPVGAQLAFHGEVLDIGRSSIKILVEAEGGATGSAFAAALSIPDEVMTETIRL